MTCVKCCAWDKSAHLNPRQRSWTRARCKAVWKAESAQHAGYDGYKRKKGSKVHLAVDALGHLLALRVTPANEGERAQVAALAQAIQEVTGQSVQIAYVDQGYKGYSGQDAAQDAQEHGIRLEVVKLQEARRGFVLLPKRWVVERSFAWATRFRRLAKDYERLPETVEGLHFLAFACSGLCLLDVGSSQALSQCHKLRTRSKSMIMSGGKPDITAQMN